MIKLYLQLFVSFAKVGLLGYGGGPSMIPLIQAEVVRHKWLTDTEFVDALAMGNALPGPIATKMSGYTGYKIAGWPGALLATSGMAFPTMVLMVGLAVVYFRFRDKPFMKAMLTGVRPAVVALLFAVVVEVWPESMARGWPALLIGAATLGAVLALKLHPALAIVAAALVGLVFFR